MNHVINGSIIGDFTVSYYLSRGSFHTSTRLGSRYTPDIKGPGGRVVCKTRAFSTFTFPGGKKDPFTFFPPC